MKQIITVLACVLLHIMAPAQVERKVLQIGDTLFASMLPTELRNDERAGRLTIFDFWSVNCISCIKSFPKLDSLQQQFGNKLNLVLVTKNTDAEVAALFAKRKKLQRPGLVMINGDTVLSRLFAYVSVPHLVWVDSGRMVRYITSGGIISAKTIQAELDGKQQALYVKEDVSPFEAKLPYDDIDERFLYYSYLMKRIKGLAGSSTRTFIKDSLTNKICGLHISSASMLSLYKIAYGKDLNGGLFMYDNSIEVQVQHREKYLRPDNFLLWKAWEDIHCYRYTLKAPVKDKESLFILMQKEMNNLFGMNCRIERKKVNCLVLQQKEKSLLRVSGGGTSKFVYEENEPLLQLENVPLSALVSRIAFENQQMPVVDETGFIGKTDIMLHARANDLKKLREELQRYGLVLTEAIREREVLVISE